MELHDLELADVARRIRRRDIGCEELTGYMLDRIERHDPHLCAFFTVTAERARDRARAADAEIARGLWRGPLHGVPIAIKDVFDTDFAPTSAGMAIRKSFVPATNATVVERLERAGAIILGKLATSEGVFFSHHPEFRKPRNPRDEARWSGVSSSGSGVATAAGLCFGSLGSDTGGSIRFPSSIHGLTGMKPTWGRVSRAGVVPLSPTFDHVGPMARSARDAAILLAAIAGRDAADPTSLADPATGFDRRLSASVAGMRIGIDEHFIHDRVDPQIGAAVMAAVRELEGLGATLVPVKVPSWRKVVDGWAIVAGSEAAIAHADTYPREATQYGPELTHLLETGRAVSGPQLAQALIDRQEFNGSMAALFEGIDLLPSPVLPVPVPLDRDVGALLATPGVDLGRFTIPADVTGQPAICLPVGRDDAGHPIGLHLAGRMLGDQTVLDAAAAYQRVSDWHTLHPAI